MRRTFSEYVSAHAVVYRVGQKVSPYTDLSINRFILKKSTVILHVHQLRATASYIKLFALLLVLHILWFSVTDTRMHKLILPVSQSIDTALN